MKPRRKTDTKNASMVNGVLSGVLSSVVISLICAAITAMLIVNGNAAESTEKYFAFGTILLSVFIGTVVAWRIVGEKPAQVCGLVGAVYCFILVSGNVLLLDGIFANAGLSVLMILLGCAGTCVIAMRQGTGKKSRRIRFR